MTPKYRNRRLFAVGGGAVVLAAGVALLATALESTRQYFYTPSEVAAAGFVPGSAVVRVGGDVVEGSVARQGDEVTFRIRDFEVSASPELAVSYAGAIPDLFMEGSGVVVVGEVRERGLRATELLAKHDENYRPEIN